MPSLPPDFQAAGTPVCWLCGGHGVGWHSPEGTVGPGTSRRPGRFQVTHGEAAAAGAEPVALGLAAVTRSEPGSASGSCPCSRRRRHCPALLPQQPHIQLPPVPTEEVGCRQDPGC